MAKKITKDAPLFGQNEIDWNEIFKPLLKKYKGKKHPLNYQNLYQLLVMVVLSARDSDRNINSKVPALFEKFPSMKHLAKSVPEDLFPFISKVSNFNNKATWLCKTAKEIKDDKNIPLTMDELISYSGIGRKSANVIMSQMNVPAAGIIVDLHTLRVSPRIGVAKGTNPEKIEKQLMEIFDRKKWHEVGMALTFLGRETCRPTNPKCHDCVLQSACEFYKLQK